MNKFDEIESETPIGLPSLGKRGWIGIPIMLALLALVVSMVSAGIANAADGMSSLVLLTRESSQYNSQVPPKPVITGYGCTISMQGQAAPGSRLILQVTLGTDTTYILAYTDIGKDGMIRDIVFVEDRIVPGEGRSVEAKIIETWFDDGATTTTVTTAHVGNPVGSGC